MRPLIGIKLQLRDKKNVRKRLLGRRCNKLANLAISKPSLISKAFMGLNTNTRYVKSRKEEGSKKK